VFRSSIGVRHWLTLAIAAHRNNALFASRCSRANPISLSWLMIRTAGTLLKFHATKTVILSQIKNPERSLDSFSDACVAHRSFGLLNANHFRNRPVSFLAEAFDYYDVFGAAEAPVPLAIVDYSLSHNVADSWKVLQLLCGRGVQINALLVRLRLRD